MNIVIIQMRALGLIKKDERQRSLRDTSTYWSLTSYGDTVMTRLKAIRRKSTRAKLPDPMTPFEHATDAGVLTAITVDESLT